MKPYKNEIFFLVIMLALLFQLANPTVAYADDEPPTAPTEVATEAPPPTEEEPVVVAPTETPAPVVIEETDVAPETAGLPATDTPLAVAEESSLPVTPVTDTAPEEEPSLEEVLQDLPEQTHVIVLDEEGQAVPLVTQQAAEIVAEGDPVWCPTGQAPTPGANGCSASFGSLSALVAGFVPTGNGTIWIQSGAQGGSAVTIDGSGSWSAAQNFSLILQGGWSGTSGDNTIGLHSIFSVPITISYWNSNVRVNNITITDINGLTLDNIHTTGKASTGGNIVGAVNVRNSTFLNGPGGEWGVSITTKGNVSLENVTASGYGAGYSAYIDNLADGNITINNSSFNNSAIGLLIKTNGDISMNGITANNNWSDAGVVIWPSGDNTAITINTFNGSGNSSALQIGTGNTVAINLSNVNVSYNGGGMNIWTKGNITLNSVTASSNNWSGALLNSLGGNVVITGTNVFNNNLEHGLIVVSKGNVAMNGATANISAIGNHMNGVVIKSNGNITMKNITAIGNWQNGTVLSNTGGAGYVTLGGANIFSDNRENGLVVLSHGNITLNHITANDNDQNGVLLFTRKNTTINGVTFQSNDQYGIEAAAVCGTLSINGVSFGSNTAGNVNFPTTGSHAFSFTYEYTVTDGGGSRRITEHESETMYCNPRVYINGQLIFGKVLSINIPFSASGSHAEFGIDCSNLDQYNVTLPNGDQVQIVCPVTGKAEIWRLDSTTLPADLPIGYNYASAFDLKIWQGSESIPYIREGGKVNISFKVPSQEPGTTYSILYWDNGTWVPLKDFLIDEDGNPRVFNLYSDDPRMILSGLQFVQKHGSLRAEVSTNFPGIFVLVQQ